MKMDIPKNTYVTHDEVAKYFEEISVDMLYQRVYILP